MNLVFFFENIYVMYGFPTFLMIPLLLAPQSFSQLYADRSHSSLPFTVYLNLFLSLS